MAENTRSLQECRRLDAVIQEMAEQMRQLAASNASQAAELEELKQKVATTGYNHVMGEEISQRGDEQVAYPDRRRDSGQGHNPYAAPTRQTRVEFPRFAGDDLRGWLYRCEIFFELDGTPWDMKVKVVAVHLEGRALQWHRMYMQKRVTRDTPHWEEYLLALHIRFGTTVFEDPMAKLMTLRQTRDLEECLERFESLLGRVSLPEDYAVSCLLSVVKEEIADVVRMHKPKSLLEAYALARQQNINIKHARSRQFGYGGMGNRLTGVQQMGAPYTGDSSRQSAISGVLPTPKQQVVPYKPYKPYKMESRPGNSSRRLTSAEMDEKRRRGVCFWCDEKFTFGHKCGTKQLRMITIEELEDTEDHGELTEVITEEGVSEDSPQLSLCALIGDVQDGKCNTMRVVGKVKRGTVSILIDSGSTHNFLDPYKAKRMGYETEQITPVLVTVANGDRLVCREVCRNFMWSLQNKEFRTDVFLLRLGGCDMVLGVAWLATLGNIMWNFQDFSMRFIHEGEEHVLQGSTELQQEEVEVQALEKLMQRASCSSTQPTRYIVFVQGITDVEINALQLQSDGKKEGRERLQQLLCQFQDSL